MVSVFGQSFISRISHKVKGGWLFFRRKRTPFPFLVSYKGLYKGLRPRILLENRVGIFFFFFAAKRGDRRRAWTTGRWDEPLLLFHLHHHCQELEMILVKCDSGLVPSRFHPHWTSFQADWGALLKSSKAWNSTLAEGSHPQSRKGSKTSSAAFTFCVRAPWALWKSGKE